MVIAEAATPQGDRIWDCFYCSFDRRNRRLDCDWEAEARFVTMRNHWILRILIHPLQFHKLHRQRERERLEREITERERDITIWLFDIERERDFNLIDAARQRKLNPRIQENEEMGFKMWFGDVYIGPAGCVCRYTGSGMYIKAQAQAQTRWWGRFMFFYVIWSPTQITNLISLFCFCCYLRIWSRLNTRVKLFLSLIYFF